MKEVILEARSRQGEGKGEARKLRAAGRIPAVVYGRDEKPVPIELERESFHNAMRGISGENLLINLSIDGKSAKKKALIREMQRDPVDGHLLHIDFMHISMTEKIRVEIPIELVGTPIGVKEFGGIVSWVIREVEVFCLPADIPDKITLDISALRIHDSIHVKDLPVQKVEIQENPEMTVVSIVPPTVIKEAAVEVEAVEGEAAVEARQLPGAEEGAEPEVITEKKAEERQAEKGKAEKGKPEKGKADHTVGRMTEKGKPEKGKGEEKK